MYRVLLLAAAAALFLAACGSDAESDGAADGGQGTEAADGTGEDVSGETQAGSGADTDDTDGGTVGDDDDAAEIVGDPDLDLDDLPDEVAEALDDIDDVVSIGDCRSDVVGLAVTAPEGWRCRVLDQPGALDGFTVFTDGNQLNITIGTPSPLGPPCEILGACDQAEAIALSDQYPDTHLFSLAGTVTIWGNHATADAELVITKPSALTDDDVDLIRAVLDSTVGV